VKLQFRKKECRDLKEKQPPGFKGFRTTRKSVKKNDTKWFEGDQEVSARKKRGTSTRFFLKKDRWNGTDGAQRGRGEDLEEGATRKASWKRKNLKTPKEEEDLGESKMSNVR